MKFLIIFVIQRRNIVIMDPHVEQVVFQQSITQNLKGVFSTGNSWLDLGLALIVSSFVGYLLNIFKEFDWQSLFRWFQNRKKYKYFYRIEYQANLNERSGWEVNKDVYGQNIDLIKAIYSYIKDVKKVEVNEKKLILDHKAVDRPNIYLEELDRPIVWIPTEVVEVDQVIVDFRDQDRDNKNDNKSQDICVLLSGPSDEVVHTFVNNCYQNYVEHRYGQYKNQKKHMNFMSHYYNGTDIYFCQIPITPLKTVDNVFFSQKERMMKYLDRFLEDIGCSPVNPTKVGQLNSSEVDHKSLLPDTSETPISRPRRPKLNRFSLLLHGPAGTGKTSIIKMLANYTGRHVQYVKLSEIQTLLDAFKILFSETIIEGDTYCRERKVPIQDRILVFEDIDAETQKVHRRRVLDQKKKEQKNKKADQYNDSDNESDDEDSEDTKKKKVDSSWKMDLGLNLSDILQLLDGIVDIQGLMIVMTTNHPEILDEALTRPGRITMKLHLGAIDTVCSREMIYYHFPMECDQEPEFLETLHIKDNCLTPCQLENFCQESVDLKQLHDFLLTAQVLL